jgi:hypothetical protein
VEFGLLKQQAKSDQFWEPSELPMTELAKSHLARPLAARTLQFAYEVIAGTVPIEKSGPYSVKKTKKSM